MVYRIFVEKQSAFAEAARALQADLVSFLGIEGIAHVRLLNRYDVENIMEANFLRSKPTVFYEPQIDVLYDECPVSEDACFVFAAEYLPGQFDQRADSAAQCIQLLCQCERPIVRSARVYCIYGNLSEADIGAIKAYVINPVESREASLLLPETLQASSPPPDEEQTLNGFVCLPERLLFLLREQYGLAMDNEDLLFAQEYFALEQRDPTLTELRVIDTYWSDHCRHTTFLTELYDVSFDHPTAAQMFEKYMALRTELQITKPVTLMDIATIAAKQLVKTGALATLDESEEINACTVKVNVDCITHKEPWLLLFKNETHNHPTEIEPFGGAATCIGGAIRDPLSGRGYVYQAMRVTGAGDPTRAINETRTGKLPQRKIVTEAAAGYSSYGNQIGLATGLVDELYHPGYTAKRMEIGAVVGAAPQENVKRLTPAPGDCVVLLGGRTGRDGCGGATGSSKTHSTHSLSECAAEVQKGNAPEERKLQRLFRNPEAAQMIKRCNDFGAGGVSVAIGELADGLHIDLDAIPKKYDGLSGTELAISESQERMAVVLAPADLEKFLSLATEENLEATPVALVTAQPRLRMQHRGETIVDLSRAFLNSNGAKKRAKAHVKHGGACAYPFATGTVKERLRLLCGDLNVCGKRGLIERFDSTIGAGSVLMPLGGKYQRTPSQAMAAKLPVLNGDTRTCSFMAYGCNPYHLEADPYAGAYTAVVSSIAKLVASGASLEECYLTLQEYFPRLHSDPTRWGQPLAALLGALDAQLSLGIAAIGGKDSMSGSFEELDVPPTLVSFAVALGTHENARSPEFKRANSRIALLTPAQNKHGLADAKSLRTLFEKVSAGYQSGEVLSAWTPGYGGVIEGVFKMTLGNRIGCALSAPEEVLFSHCYGGMIIETLPGCTLGEELGRTIEEYTLFIGNEGFSIAELEQIYDNTLEAVYPTEANTVDTVPLQTYAYTQASRRKPAIRYAKARVLIPVFPGTNCEYDAAAAFSRAGAVPELFVVRNITREAIGETVAAFSQALAKSQILFLPGGFSGGDEPDGSAKFIAAFLRNARIATEIDKLLTRRRGLIGGICNGFQALIKLGLLPYGEIRDMDASCPTLTYNTIGRHQSKLVRTRVSSTLSPWLSCAEVGDVYMAPVSHGEGRFVCTPELISSLAERGQIATQYVDTHDHVTMQIQYNPNGSASAVEGLTSPDGLVFGKMAHTERMGEGLYKNVPHAAAMPLFSGAVQYFD
ncbi:phosphoribosylformylglycinamidine synthase [Christensenellaceae bacterium OttesenSCG-928-L17]|nr:phosphoribosylformylglycinamidine synthase [Christensenellaceae bacterium OttesenSCG-928-L17]